MIMVETLKFDLIPPGSAWKHKPMSIAIYFANLPTLPPWWGPRRDDAPPPSLRPCIGSSIIEEIGDLYRIIGEKGFKIQSTLPSQIRVVCPKFGHPALTLSFTDINFCRWKIVLQLLCMNWTIVYYEVRKPRMTKLWQGVRS